MKVNISSSVGLGQAVELEAEPADSVGSLVEKVAQIQAINPESISLVKDGKVLDKGASLKKAGVKDGDSLKAMPRDPIGGSQPLPSLSPLTRQRIQGEVQRIQDARIPLRFVSPLHVEGRLVGKGKWSDQDLFFDAHPGWRRPVMVRPGF